MRLKATSESNFREEGYVLPIALALTFVLLVLLLSLARSGQQSSQVLLQEELTFQETVLSFDTENKLGLRLSGHSGPETGEARIDQGFSSSKQRADLTLSWGKDSLHRGPRELWADYDALFTGREELAKANYSELQETSKGLPVAPDHTIAAFHLNGQRRKSVVYSAGFPYGAYAPYGNITLEKALSWRNPSLKETTEEPDYQKFTGLPVDLRAQGHIKVERDYPAGAAYSDTGPIEFHSDSGAIGYTYPQPSESYTDDLTAQINERYYYIGRDQIDKTHLFGDAVLNAGGLVKLFAGNLDFREILSVGQASKVPFFPIPSVQEDVAVIIFALHHPWPVDFSGQAHNTELSKELARLRGELVEAKEELEKLKREKNELDPDSATYDDDLKAIEQKIQGQISKIDWINKSIQKVSDELKEQADEISDNIAVSEVPKNAQEEKEQTVEGWSYVRILGSLFQIVADLIAKKDPLSALAIPTRVVNLGDQDPDWKWSGKKTEMEGTLTVPRGRTLCLSQDLEIAGDLWLQRGSTCYLKGSNLTVSAPDEWFDFTGEDVTPGDFTSFPSGRIIMEPGSTLLVDGNLTVEGGSLELGSMLLVGPLGPTQAIDRAILARGRIEIAHGIHPGMGVDDLILELADEDKNLRNFVQNFYNPLLVEGFPFLAKFPYVGPWQTRKCWFASYATTFEFFPEAGPFAGPYPIPLPFPNCLKKVFKYLSFAFSTELNFTTGENLYTQSPLWLFGRGMTPVFTKTDPVLVKEAFENLEWEEIVTDALVQEGKKFVEDVLPDLVKEILLDAVRDILEALAREMIPFSPPSCGGSEESSKGDIAEKIGEKMEELLKDQLKETGKKLLEAFKKTIVVIKNEVMIEIADDSKPRTIVRELPGVLVYSGRELSVGHHGAICASGMFYAEEDVISEARYTVGCLLSANGNVEAQTLYHFPFYSRASLYNPLKPKDYKVNVVDDFFRSALQVEVPDPGKNTAGDIGRPMYHITAEGWGK